MIGLVSTRPTALTILFYTTLSLKEFMMNLFTTTSVPVKMLRSVLMMLLICFGHAGVAAEAKTSKVMGYELGPEDVLDISVWKEDDLNKQVVVRPDGAISFPLAGNLVVAGMTVDKVQDTLTSRIRKYIPGAVVSVSVAKISAYKIYVTGKVKNPGEYVLGSYVSVIKAITIADGLTPYAKESSIKIIRTARDGTETVFPFNYSKVKSGKKLGQNIILKSGDVVLVP